MADNVCEDQLTFMTAWLNRLMLGVVGRKITYVPVIPMITQKL